MTERRWRPTVAEVDLAAIRRNLLEMRRFVGPNTEIMAVVKADAYGHGMLPVAGAALSAGADWLGVAIAEEAIALRAGGFECPILVLGHSEPAAAPELVKQGISVTVFNPEGLMALQRAASSLGLRAKAQLKLDTGMHRLGIKDDSELVALLSQWKVCDKVDMEGAFSHFAAADQEDLSYTYQQDRRFRRMLHMVWEAGFAPKVHICNTAGALAVPQAQYDMIRLGIGLYGYPPSAVIGERIHFSPAMSVRSALSRVFSIDEGEAVGYGCSFVAKRPMRVGTIPIGYGDGYRRAFSNRGHVLIGGRPCALLGRVCMDQCMVDITDIPHVKPGDEVVLMGRQGECQITAEDWALWADSISYEMMLGLTKRVPRIYVDGDKLT